MKKFLWGKILFMKRRILGILLIMFLALSCSADDSIQAEKTETSAASNAPLIFRYHIPDEEETEEVSEENSQEESLDITTDDITADTSSFDAYIDSVSGFDSEYYLEDMYSDVLQGYASYDEDYDDEDVVTLDDVPDSLLEFNIKVPQKVEEKLFPGLQTTPSLFKNPYSKFSHPEYSIAPVSAKNSIDVIKGFSAGTTYSQYISSGELEQASGIFSRYEYKNFAITTSFLGTVNSTNNDYGKNFYLTPELKINQYFTLKENLSADAINKKKKAEFVISVNPFGDRDSDRLRFELGASQTYDENYEALKSQFRFSTNFKF